MSLLVPKQDTSRWDKRRSREITLNETDRLEFLNPVQQAASIAAPEL